MAPAGYNGLQRATTDYKGYSGLQRATAGYNGLQRATRAPAVVYDYGCDDQMHGNLYMDASNAKHL